FKFERNHIDMARKIFGGLDVVVCGIDFDIGDLSSRAIVSRIKRVHAISHAPRRDGEHATELSAAEDADGFAGKDWHKKLAAVIVGSASADRLRSLAQI